MACTLRLLSQKPAYSIASSSTSCAALRALDPCSLCSIVAVYAVYDMMFAVEQMRRLQLDVLLTSVLSMT
jgi:hypothetical protein